MTTTTRNHLAQDLVNYMAEDDWDAGITLLDEALAAERRATVERIRARVVVYVHDGDPWLNAGDLPAILDEEAAR